MYFNLPNAQKVALYQGNIANKNTNLKQDNIHNLCSRQKKSTPKQNFCAQMTSLQCLNTRAAALNLQKSFLVWQEAMQNKKGKEGVNALHEYEIWYAEQVKNDTKNMTEAQLGQYNIWADMQNILYKAWVEKYTKNQEYQYALNIQQDIIFNSKAFIQNNAQCPDFIQQGIEQILAATQELAFLQNLSSKEGKNLAKNEVSLALKPIINSLQEMNEKEQAELLSKKYAEFILPLKKS